VSRGTPHFSSECVSVVDDVLDSLVSSSRQVESDDNQQVIDLGNGYLEIDGCVFYEDLDEIAGSDGDEVPGIPHEVVMAEIREMLKKPR
jgi:hypothetical protein